MRDSQLPLRLIRVGCVAARALREGARGRVTAVFERSFYCTLGDQWICIGPLGLGDGPLNALYDATSSSAPCRAHGTPNTDSGAVPGPCLRGDERDSPIAFTIGDIAAIENRVLRIASTSVALDRAVEWNPPSPPAFEKTALAAGLKGFAAALPAVLPIEGLAHLLSPSTGAMPPVAQAARVAALHLVDLVRHPDAVGAPVDAAPLIDLLGLGPGLTPSGDDFLGGAMVVLHLIRRDRLRDAIWRTLAPHAATLTNDISRAHLAAAAEGVGSAALHGLLDDVLVGRADEMPTRIAALAAIGHTSGWDALAGAIAVLRASSAPTA